jgi:anti-sigma28 factor (negative regulator of flagellin synthesis)
MAVTPLGGAQPSKKATGVAAETTSVADQQIAKVSISSEARQLATSGGQGVLNSEKVDSLKTALESNSLKFDSAKIAERMVAALG